MSTHTDVLRQSVRLSPTSGPALNVEYYDGDAPACILIHGGGDGAFIWDLFAPALARRFTTLALDLRGHGDSGRDPQGQYAIDGYVCDVALVIEHFGFERFALIGHSLGAHVAIRLCAKYAARVAASVLVDSGPWLDAASREHAITLLKHSLRRYSTIDEYRGWLGATRPLADRRALDLIASRALQPAAGRFLLKLDPSIADHFPEVSAQQSEFLWQLLEQQHCPTLVLRGAGSALLSRATAQRMSETLPRGRFETVDGAGHAVMIDNPSAFERVVLAFLERVL